MPIRNQHSCVICARRKIRCDKQSPCSSCFKSQAVCTYRTPVPSQRHRRRLTQGDLLSRIQELEALLHDHRIPFDRLDTSWIRSRWEERLIGSSQSRINLDSSIDLAMAAVPHPALEGLEVLDRDVQLVEEDGAAQPWSRLPEVVRCSLLEFVSLLTAIKAEKSPNLATQTIRRGYRKSAYTY